jgi:peptide/nickel transport system permease protein
VTRYLAKRVLGAAVMLWALSVVIFVLLRALPGDPATAMLGFRATPELVARINRDLGLDRPLVVQYGDWLSGALRGDLGYSIATSGTSGRLSYRPVGETVAAGLKITLWVGLLGTAVAALFGVAGGVLAATRRSWVADTAISGVSLMGISTPDFYMAFLLILVFTVQLGWLPSVGFVDPLGHPLVGLRSLALPVMAVGLINMAAIARMTRSAILETRNSEYVFLARSRGTPESVILLKHVLRNALVPVLTVIGLQLGFLFGGVVVIETVFGLPGMGRLLLVAVTKRDYPTIQGLILAFAFLFLLINLLVDVTYALIDPRIRIR